MEKYIKLLSVCVCLLLHTCLAGAQPPQNSFPRQFKAVGTAEGFHDSVLFVSYVVKKDTIIIKSTLGPTGNMEFTGMINEPTKIFINEVGAGIDPWSGQMVGEISFWAEPGKTTRFSGIKSKPDIRASGNQSQDDQNTFDRLYQVTTDAQNQIIKRGREAKKAGNFAAVKPILDKQWDSIEVSKRNIIVDFMQRHKDSFVALDLTKKYMYAFKNNNNSEQLISAYNQLSDKVKSSPSGARVKEFLGLEGELKIGSKIKEINEPDSSGKYVSISSLKGKYVLIEFWASWCVPCRQIIPELKRVHQKFQNRNFTILGVSIDDKKEKWIEALSQEKMNWYNVSDLKGTDGFAAKVFNINSIPQNILIDGDGTIIAKNLTVTELSQKLDTALPQAAN